MLSLRNILPITQVKRDLMKLIESLKKNGAHVVITKEGKAEGVLMSSDEYEALMETLDILSDQKILEDLKKAKEDFKKGRIYSHDEVFGK